jgi:DNA-directed RNA polymerase specialized sigma24 family protein
MPDEALKPARTVTDDLVVQTRAGDSRAFERLVGDYQLRVFRWALAFAVDADEAEDITQ